jgi:hypothetical protein
MKTFDEILLQLQNDISKDLPAMLQNNSLQNFDEYAIGSSKDPKQKSLLIYYAGANFDKLTNEITIILHLQLFQCEEFVTAKYMQIVVDYVKQYKPERIGMNILDTIEVEIYPIEKNSATFVLVICTFQEFLDSCDKE